MMKKLLAVLLLLSLLLTLSGCSDSNTVKQDDSPITIFVGLGNGQAYDTALQQAIKDNLGIEVQLVYQAAIDTTSAVMLEFKNGDLPADIVMTSSPMPAEYARNACMDYIANTHLTDAFTYRKVQQYTNSDGTVYQLPFTSKLIGITYNKTLMEENGWQVPTTYEEMLALKQQCDEKGILFAVSANVATGHGFNDLFHLMGAQWLSTLEGSEWLTDFLSGKEDISRFAAECTYFSDWVENGLFGSIHSADWGARQEFSSRRALFFFDLDNNVFSYDGEMVDENGVSTGVTLHDEYAMMPFISRDGSNNCFTYYDCMFLSMNKNLASADQKDRLEKVIKILDFMTTQTATDLFASSTADGYVAVKTFAIDESRAYYAYKDSVENGYIMPWYYSYFDQDTIVNTGDVINHYMRGDGGELSTVLAELDRNNTNYINKNLPAITTLDATLTYEETAKLNAIGAILSLQNTADGAGVDAIVTAALVPYVKQVSDHVPFTTKGVVSTHAYAGAFREVDLETIISAKGQKVMGIEMTGKQLKEIAAAGLTDGSSVYPYALVATVEIQDEGTYLVAVSQACLDAGLVTKFTESGAVLLAADGSTVTAPIKWGVKEFLTGRETVSAKDLVLN